MTNMPWLFVVTTPRSGSTQTLFLLSAFDGVYSFAELFNPPHPTYLDKRTLALFSRVTGFDIRGQKDPRLGSWIAHHRDETLEILQRYAPGGARVTCLKVFSGHLDIASFKRHLVDRPNAHFLFVKRNPVDAFISFEKAKLADAWLNVDTTSQRVSIDPKTFGDWHRTHSLWFHETQKVVAEAKRPSATLTYYDDLLVDEETSIRRVAAAASELGLDLVIAQRRRGEMSVKRAMNGMIRAVGFSPPFRDRFGLQKQDNALSREDKVTNWKQFSEAVAEMPGGLRMFDEYFQ